MAYVPPHRLKSNDSKASSSIASAAERYHIKDIQRHYRSNAADDGKDDEAFPSEHSTLNDSASSEKTLTYMLLFDQANPRWESDHIIFAKSNLHLLPQYEETKSQHGTSNDENTNSLQDPTDKAPVEITPLNPKPITCFEQRKASSQFRNPDMKFGNFEFAGYYTITNIALLAPFSQKLIHMLEQKWARTDSRGKPRLAQRHAHDWEASLNHEWAVIKFAKMEGENVPPAPVIEKWTLDEGRPGREAGSRKTVNELLAEMRLGNAAGEGTHKQGDW